MKRKGNIGLLVIFFLFSGLRSSTIGQPNSDRGEGILIPYSPAPGDRVSNPVQIGWHEWKWELQPVRKKVFVNEKFFKELAEDEIDCQLTLEPGPQEVVIIYNDYNEKLYFKFYVITFMLSQNYPNPFNPATTISYDLSAKSYVQLTVFNATGQTIARLVDKEQNAGSYQVSWDGSAVPTGVYFYRIEAGDFVQTKKMTLMK
ncbi:MAG TPA: T9SS type A sorting domain-containing protein [Prolixibacteraceae bacterium]|nr:T9SS type A sorting domain-containing protein [Prolixibacteraceae bacterium]